jgi:SecD/SecF fusion protein
MNLLLAAEEVVTNAAEAPAMSSARGWLVFLGILAVIFVPFLLGNAIARALRMRDTSTRIGVVLFSLVLAAGPFVANWAEGKSLMDAVHLGIDLAGGTNMVFAVDREAAKVSGKEVTSEVMDKMVSAVSRRVNPTGTEEVTVRKVGVDRIEVIVPGADQEKVDATKRKIVDLGKLEFSVLANEAEHQDLIQRADALGNDKGEIFRDGLLIGKWRRAAIDAETGEPKIQPGDRVHTRTVTQNDKQALEYLVVVDPDPKRRITGDLLKSVRDTITDKGLAVGFTFNERGGYLMQQLTSKYQPRTGAGYKTRLAVLLNEEIHSAPTINAVIGSSGVIEGSFTQEEVDELISVLNAGALQVPLMHDPVSEFTVSPLLGIDIQRKGFTAMVVSVVLVFLVTLAYYLKAGFIADICLAINILLTMGAMALIDATFTLPGLAGLVLSIGMAVDANVLIFERMREEKAKGSSTRMAIKNGFEKAYSTIFDSNVTTLISAVVLYYIGTDQIRGFAVTLFIGIVMSMFSAVYIGRLIFDIGEHKRWIKDLKMVSLIHAERIDFLGKKWICAVISTVLIVGGMTAIAIRGSDNLDIDFRGGSMVTFKFVGETPTADEVHQALEQKFEESLSLERLEVPQNGKTQVLFRMRTIESDAQKVSDGIREVFADTPYVLVQQHVTLGKLVEIPKPESAGDKEDLSNATPDPFLGGHEMEVKLSETMLPSSLADEVQSELKSMEGYEHSKDLVRARSLSEGESKDTDIKVELAAAVTPADAQRVLETVEKRLEGRPYFEELNTFDQSVSGDMKSAAILALAISLLAIVAYLWIRFQRVMFGVAACAALVHDVLITLGFIAFGAYLSGNPVGQFLGLEDFKINLSIVAAFLTIIGYSLNDTIVVFDRVREVRGRNPIITEQMVNQSLNQTLSRTLLTSATTFVVLIVLYFMGGKGIHGFAYCMILGIIFGTYSSIYIASPILIWLLNRQTRRITPAASPMRRASAV